VNKEQAEGWRRYSLGMEGASSKQILIVGGSSGIGGRVIDALLADSHLLTVTIRKGAEFEARPGLTLQPFDASDQKAELALPESLDGVVYLPGTNTLKPFTPMRREQFENDMEVNFFGAVKILQAALPALKRSGSESASVVLFSTVAVGTGMPFHASIAAAKGAVEGLTRSLAAEWAPRIRVNAIAPSLTDTPLAGSLLSSDERRAVAAKRHPMNRVGDAGDIAKLVKFLLGDSSRFVTGQVFGIDGGMSSVRQFA
jgi:3-oxoacyl-[acyl-carrier protein] reductase